VRQVPPARPIFPSRALATEGGGEIAIDPRDTKGPKALERMFQFDVALAGIPRLENLRRARRTCASTTAWSRCACGGIAPCGFLFLSRFGVLELPS